MHSKIFSSICIDSAIIEPFLWVHVDFFFSQVVIVLLVNIVVVVAAVVVVVV